MNRKLFCLLFCTIFLLSGCKEQMVMLEYDDSMELSLPVSKQIDKSCLLSSDVCVIGIDEVNDKNSALVAASSLLVDVTEDKKIFANDVYEQLYPASITKIVTALVVLKQASLDDVVIISKTAANITEPGAKLCGFKEGDRIILKDLLQSFLVYSGNDAGTALAEHVAGSVKDFAEMMNKEAKNIGAVDSNFVNPHGLHNDDHYTTAYDIYLFFDELTNYNIFLDIIHLGRVTVSYQDKNNNTITKTFITTDRYLNGRMNPPEGVTVLGGKTGTTSKAGSCLVLYSQGENGNKFISVVLNASGGNALFNQMNVLLSMIKKQS